MSDKDNAQKRSNTRNQKKITSNTARNQSIAVEVMNGKSTKEVAKEFGISQSQVNRILSSDEIKQIGQEGESRIYLLLDQAIDRIKHLLFSSDENVSSKIALAIARTCGAISEKVNVNHSVSKPIIIRTPEGSVIIGMSGDENKLGEKK